MLYVSVSSQCHLPVAFTTTIFLGLLRVSIDEAMLGEVTGKMLFWSSGAVSETGMITVILLVRASHCATVLLVDAICHERLHHGLLGRLSPKH